VRGVKKRAAARLGISFRSFRYRLEKLGLEEPGDDEPE
jgi:DNA-binding NtrC family response regulator